MSLTVVPGTFARMTSERIKELHDARPFKPFAIRMADGRSVRVRHPEFLSRSPSGRTIQVFESDERAHYIDVLLVTEREVGNGARPRSRRC
jgi:hypothetical protein